MKNNKGFTLVELLAMLVVLGILMAVTIPNMSGILGNTRLNKTKNDATQIIEIAKTRVARDAAISKPKNKECLILTLNFLDDNEEFTNGASEGLYQQYDSFVLYTREGSRYKYYLRLVETKDGKNTGLRLIESTEIDSLKNSDIKTIDALYGLSNNRQTSIESLKEKADITAKCDQDKISYYVHRES